MPLVTLQNLGNLLGSRFDANLLSIPVPSFREDSNKLWRIYKYINSNLKKKLRNYPVLLEKFTKLENEFIGLYERAKIKEEERKKEVRHKTQEPFYNIGSIGEKDEKVFRRLRFK